jgi:hypothetical protein
MNDGTATTATTTKAAEWKTRAAFMVKPGAGWTWLTWSHAHGCRHAAIIEKARELGAVAWDFGQADHGEVGRVNF